MQEFEFSSWPARWGPPVCGAFFAIVMILVHLTIHHNLLGTALLMSVIAVALIHLVSRWLLGSGIRIIPWSRHKARNLIATPRGSVQSPEIWFVAHVDSKSQTIPMLVRVASVATAVMLFVLTVGVLIAAAVLRTPAFSRMGVDVTSALYVAWYAAFFAAVATLPLIFCFIGNKSFGALDNASGFAAVALAVEMVRDRERVGVIVTSGEELGLAGARAFVEQMPAKAIAINCDTIDDGGGFLCMVSKRMPDRLSSALDRAAGRVGVSVRKQALLPGVLADSVAFSRAGWASFTLSRGNLGTLARVHTSRDRSDKIDGTGIAVAAQLLAATAEELS